MGPEVPTDPSRPRPPHPHHSGTVRGLSRKVPTDLGPWPDVSTQTRVRVGHGPLVFPVSRRVQSPLHVDLSLPLRVGTRPPGSHLRVPWGLLVCPPGRPPVSTPLRHRGRPWGEDRRGTSSRTPPLPVPLRGRLRSGRLSYFGALDGVGSRWVAGRTGPVARREDVRDFPLKGRNLGTGIGIGIGIGSTGAPGPWVGAGAGSRSPCVCQESEEVVGLQGVWETPWKDGCGLGTLQERQLNTIKSTVDKNNSECLT